MLGAALTWSLAATASVAAYSGLVAGGLLDPVPVVEGINSEDMSPQLEVGAEGGKGGRGGSGEVYSSPKIVNPEPRTS